MASDTIPYVYQVQDEHGRVVVPQGDTRAKNCSSLSGAKQRREIMLKRGASGLKIVRYRLVFDYEYPE